MYTNNYNNHRPAQQDNNKIAHHAIRLPKGGGAISGMGEKFQANAVTGTGNFSIPLPVTPGRDEFAPDLALGYNSGSGNTPFGLGWDIGLPAITRSTDKQLPTYNDAENKDTFILSGAEDLVPVLEKTGEEWIKSVGARFIAPISTMPEDNYQITSYRPRIEGLFARIEKWRNTSNGEVHWQAITKDNVTSYYGLTEQARIVDSANTRKVFSWLIEKTINAKGSTIDYEYKQENSDNIPADITEYQRLSKSFAFNQKYLKHIKYAPMSNDATNHHMQLVLDYGEHTTDN